MNLRLYRLSATDVATLMQEEKDVEKLIKNIKAILDSDTLLKNHLKENFALKDYVFA